MDPQTLVEELERLQAGETDAESRVLFLISRTTLFLLTDGDSTSDGSSSLTFRAKLVDVEGHQAAYLFSSEVLLNHWCIAKNIEPHALPIHGADLSIALSADTWLKLDPDTPYTVLLSPEQMKNMGEAIVKSDMEMVVLEEADGGFVSPFEETSRASAPALYTPIEEHLKKEQELDGPKKRRFASRSSPTTLFAAPSIKKKEDFLQPRDQSYTSSKLKRVIKSTKPEE